MHYPLKDVFGRGFCYFCSYLEPYGFYVGQFHSFFTTVFRYICLFHSEEMLKHDITPKVSPFLLLRTTFQFNPAFLFSSSFLLIYLYPSTTSYQQQFWPYYSMGQTQTQWIHSIPAWVMLSWIIWDKAKFNFWLVIMRTHPHWALLCAMGLL